MIKTIKVQLKPNNKQSTNLFGCAGTGRWAYNYTIAKIQEYYKATNKVLNDGEIRKQITQLKRTEEYKWLFNYSNNITKQAVKDACDAYKKFFKGLSKFPKFKSRKKSKPAFYQDNVKIKFGEKYCQIEKVGKVKLTEFNRIPFGSKAKYMNPRVTFDGLNWWISVSIEVGDLTIDKEVSEPIGIDLGIKDLAIISNGQIFKNINKTKSIKKLKKTLRRLQKQVSRKYENTKKKGGEFCYKKTKNIIKVENKIKSVYQRLTNIRTNYIHQITTSLVKNKPEYIVMETLNIRGIMKNRHLSKAIQEQCLFKFKTKIEYKCNWYGSKLILADKWYPSSKTCMECGYIKKDLNLSDRIYICPSCGNQIDRDYQASVNLREYGRLVV
jgi:putative transposase